MKFEIITEASKSKYISLTFHNGVEFSQAILSAGEVVQQLKDGKQFKSVAKAMAKELAKAIDAEEKAISNIQADYITADATMKALKVKQAKQSKPYVEQAKKYLAQLK